MGHPGGDKTKSVDPQWYFDVANRLYSASKTVEDDLNSLDGKLDVGQSAGTYQTGGPRWSRYFDQATVDIYELSSVSAMAAKQLGFIIHKHGLNHALAENGSHSGPQERTPPTPSAVPTSMKMSKNPSKRSVGATEGNPDHWDIVDPYVEKEWTNCSEGRIASAGAALSLFGAQQPVQATKMYVDIENIFTADRQEQFYEIAELMDDVADVRDGIQVSGAALAVTLGASSAVFGGQAAALKTVAKALILAFWYYVQESKYRQKILRDPLSKAVAAKIAEEIKKKLGQAIDKVLGQVSEAVELNTKTGQTMYDRATSTAQKLTDILKYEPRQVQPVRGKDIDQNSERGRLGEIRAGVDPDDREKPETVKVDVGDGRGMQEVTVIPDQVDDENRQVVEVKNTNEIRPYRTQILAEAELARQKGYSMVLIVDHRTQINDPMIQKKIESGEIQVVRKILDTPRKAS
ncbi:Uncharacterised protein [Mycobacteroides abscessus subsp. bolletii]|uniref:putative toxin n=1 Tax=Mycobacteroides abscessus TaxID=36809 RepID=UPI00092C5C0C|nr:putative toxin [Mycobacteroides abscessus]SIJ23977.1 Uncharacterised protein [Mycobacteroides abscessus subsp. bolletii]